MNFKRHLILLLLILSSITGYSQTITPQWKAVTGGLMSYFYPGKSPLGYDTLWNAQTIRSYINTHTVVYTASNGITKTGYDFGLGGDLNDYTILNTNGYGLFIQNSDGMMSVFGSNETNLTSSTDNQNNYGRLLIQGIGSFLISHTPTIQRSIEVTNAHISVSDDSFHGIVYNWDNDSNLGDSSLVPKRYVTNAIATGSTPADSALRKNKNLYDVPDKVTARANLGVKQSYIPAIANTVQSFTINGAAAKIRFAANYSNTSVNKLVIFFHYYGGTVNSAPPNGMADSLIARGYSVAQLSAGNSWGNETAKALYLQLYQYCQTYFNFQREIWGMSDSMGTLTMFNLADGGTIPFKALVGICPVVALYNYYAFGLNSSIPPAYGFTPGLVNAPAAIVGYDPYARINYRMGDTVYNANSIPFYAIQGVNDPYIGWTRTLVNAAVRGGNSYYVSEVPGFAHDTLACNASTIPAALEFMTKPAIYSRTLPTQPANIIVNSVTDNNGTSGYMPYYNTTKKLSISPIQYDATNSLLSVFGSPLSGYQYTFGYNGISNRIAINNPSTLNNANTRWTYNLPGASVSNRTIVNSFGKTTSGQGGGSVFGIIQGTFNSVGGSYYLWHQVLDSTRTRIQIQAPRMLSFGAGHNPTNSSTSDGIIGLSLLGNTSGPATLKNVIIGLDTVSNASTNIFQVHFDVTPYADNANTIGTSAFRWSTIYGNNISNGTTSPNTPTAPASTTGTQVINQSYLASTATSITNKTFLPANTFQASTGTTADSLGFWSSQKKVAKLITAGTGMSITQTATGVTFSTTALINPMTTLGDIIYGGSSGTPTRLGGNTTTTQKFLTSTGNGTTSAAPTFFDLFNTANTWGASQEISNNNLTLSQTSTGSNGALFFRDVPSGFVVTLAPESTTRTYSSTYSLRNLPSGSHGGSVAITDEIGIVNATTTALSSATLTSTYPNAIPGTKIICDSIVAGPVIYVKGSGSNWLTVAATITP